MTEHIIITFIIYTLGFYFLIPAIKYIIAVFANFLLNLLEHFKK